VLEKVRQAVIQSDEEDEDVQSQNLSKVIKEILYLVKEYGHQDESLTQIIQEQLKINLI